MKLNREKVFLIMAKTCMTQKQLAEKSGISRHTLSGIMRGQECRSDTLGKICKALEVDPKELVE